MKRKGKPPKPVTSALAGFSPVFSSTKRRGKANPVKNLIVNFEGNGGDKIINDARTKPVELENHAPPLLDIEMMIVLSILVMPMVLL